jgi:hypothetical protein
MPERRQNKKRAPKGAVLKSAGWTECREALSLGGNLFGGRGFPALHIGFTTAAFLNFIMLLSHISLLCEIDSFVYRD